LIFTARQHSLLCKRCTSYSKSVRPSITCCTVSKRLKLRSCGFTGG